jgi:hypothetical protein
MGSGGPAGTFDQVVMDLRTCCRPTRADREEFLASERAKEAMMRRRPACQFVSEVSFLEWCGCWWSVITVLEWRDPRGTKELLSQQCGLGSHWANTAPVCNSVDRACCECIKVGMESWTSSIRIRPTFWSLHIQPALRRWTLYNCS